MEMNEELKKKKGKKKKDILHIDGLPSKDPDLFHGAITSFHT